MCHPIPHPQAFFLLSFCCFSLLNSPATAEVDPLAVLNLTPKSGQDNDTDILEELKAYQALRTRLDPILQQNQFDKARTRAKKLLAEKKYTPFKAMLQQLAKDAGLVKAFVKQSVEILGTKKGQEISWKGLPATLIGLDGAIVELKSTSGTRKDRVSSLRAAHHLQLRGLNKNDAEAPTLRDCGLLAFCHGHYSSARDYLSEVSLSHPIEEYFKFMGLELESKALSKINEIKRLNGEKKNASTLQAIEAFQKTFAQTEVADLNAEFLIGLQDKIDARRSAISKAIAKLDGEIDAVYNSLVTEATKDYTAKKKKLMEAFDKQMKAKFSFVVEKKENKKGNKKGGNKQNNNNKKGGNNNKRKTQAEALDEAVLAHASLLPAVFAAPAKTNNSKKGNTRRTGKGNVVKKQEVEYALKRVSGEKSKKQVLAGLQKIYQDHKKGDKKLNDKSYETVKNEIKRLGSEITNITAQAQAKARSITTEYSNTKGRLRSRKMGLKRRVRSGARPKKNQIQSYFKTGKLG